MMLKALLPEYEVSAVMIAHDDQHMLNGSLLGFDRAVESLRRQGVAVETLIIACRCGEETMGWLSERAEHAIEQSEACRGGARNLAVALTTGSHVAIVEGDEIWSRDFLVRGLTQAKSNSDRSVLRPAAELQYSDDLMHMPHFGQRFSPRSADLDPLVFLTGNPYPSTFLCQRKILIDIPFPEEDAQRGWTDVDRWWNANLAGALVPQMPVPETFCYLRKRYDGSDVVARGEGGRIGATLLELGARRARLAARASRQAGQTCTSVLPHAATAQPMPEPARGGNESVGSEA